LTKNKINWFSVFLLLCGGLFVLFIAGPLIGLIMKTSAPQLFETISENEVSTSIGLTLIISFLATLVFALIAIPFAYLLARKNFPGKKILTGIIDLPIVIPHSAAGIALLGVISRDTIAGKAAAVLGINFVGHPAGIALAMAFVSVPFLINASRDGFLAVSENLENAAKNLGASGFMTFISIAIPLAWRNILSGFVLMFGRGMSEFGAVIIIAYHPATIPVLIFDRFTSFGLKYAQPVSVIFIAISLLIFIMLRFVSVSKKPRKS